MIFVKVKVEPQHPHDKGKKSKSDITHDKQLKPISFVKHTIGIVVISV